MRNVFAITGNVKRALSAWEQLMARQETSPGGGLLLFGTEGTGKSRTAIWLKLRYGENEFPIPFIRAKRLITGRGLLEQIVSELGEAPAWKTSDIQSQIERILSERPRPIVVDEIDYLFRDSLIEVLRDIHDACNIPIIMIGMAQAEKKLMRLPHFYDRVTACVEFHLLSREDIRELASRVCEVTFDDSAIAFIRERSGGKLRRISTLFYQSERAAKANKLKEVTAAHLQNGGKTNG